LYECARTPIQAALASVKKTGLSRWWILPGINSGDPTLMSAAQRKEIYSYDEDMGLRLSQFQLAHRTQQLASSDAAPARQGGGLYEALREFVQEAGGKEMLVWWGSRRA